MKRMMRKTAPKVVDGRVQRKNRYRTDPCYVGDRRVAIERRRPGRGYRHFVNKSEVYAFLQIVPGWEKLTRGLNQIVLDQGSETRSGWFSQGTIALCAFPRELQVEFERPFFYRDIDFFERLNVPYSFEELGDEQEDRRQIVTCQFNRTTARCYLLMRTLLHELGHHLDLATNRRQWCSRGEEFAERIGRGIERQTWSDYRRLFGDPI